MQVNALQTLTRVVLDCSVIVIASTPTTTRTHRDAFRDYMPLVWNRLVSHRYILRRTTLDPMAMSLLQQQQQQEKQAFSIKMIHVRIQGTRAEVIPATVSSTTTTATGAAAAEECEIPFSVDVGGVYMRHECMSVSMAR